MHGTDRIFFSTGFDDIAKQKRDFNREFKRGSFSRREINLINYAIERCRRILPPPWRLIDPK